MKGIERYNIPILIKRRSGESGYHMPGGRWFRNQFINMAPGQTFGPIVAENELVVMCYTGEFRLESANDEKLIVWALGAEGRKSEEEKATRLVELDQAVIEAKCPLSVVCVQPGTIQIIGAHGVWHPDKAGHPTIDSDK